MKWDEISRADILLSVLRQLDADTAKPRKGDDGLDVDNLTVQLEQARHGSSHIPTEEILENLKERLNCLKRAFLLVDGVDRCGWFSDTSFEFDILALQSLGLKVLLTSRTLAFNDEEWENATNSCDVCMRCPLRVYWRCESGLHEEPYILCQECHETSECCPDPKW